MRPLDRLRGIQDLCNCAYLRFKVSDLVNLMSADLFYCVRVIVVRVLASELYVCTAVRLPIGYPLTNDYFPNHLISNRTKHLPMRMQSIPLKLVFFLSPA